MDGTTGSSDVVIASLAEISGISEGSKGASEGKETISTSSMGGTIPLISDTDDSVGKDTSGGGIGDSVGGRLDWGTMLGTSTVSGTVSIGGGNGAGGGGLI